MAEYFNCLNCGRSVPCINKLVHDTMCSASNIANRTNSQKPPILGTSENRADITQYHLPEAKPTKATMRDQESSIWSCSTCTFENSNVDATKCELCGYSRNQAPFVKSNEDENIFTPEDSRKDSIIINDAIPFSEDFNYGAFQEYDSEQIKNAIIPEGNRWSCSMCTFLNENSHDYCNMCSNARPPLSSRRDRLIPEEEHHGSSSQYFTGNSSLVTEINHSSRAIPAPSNRGVDIATTALFGAGIGATLAWLNRRNIGVGALEGASLGAAGGMMIDLLSSETNTFNTSSEGNHNQSYHENASSRLDQNSRSANRVSRSTQGTVGHDPFIMSLIQTIEDMRSDMNTSIFFSGLNSNSDDPQGIEEEYIRQIPTHIHHCDRSIPETINSVCSVCLENFKEGDNVKVLPCLHKYHSNCIDRWLRQSSQCPVCKQNIS